MRTWKNSVHHGVVALVALGLLAACGASSAPTASSNPAAPQAATSATSVSAASAPIATPAATADDIRHVGQLIFPGPHPAGCDWHNRGVCPVTERLAARLTEITQPSPGGPGPVPPFCRCQNVPAPAAVVVGEVTPTGGIAHITLGAPRFDVVVVNQDGRLLVDDVQCAGRGPATGLYAAHLVACAP